MSEERFGLSLEERQNLTGGPENSEPMNIKMSLLAFAALLLICAMVVAASLIAQSKPGTDVASTSASSAELNPTGAAARNTP